MKQTISHADEAQPITTGGDPFAWDDEGDSPDEGYARGISHWIDPHTWESAQDRWSGWREAE